MKVLVVKLSSLGDVIHTLPALGDAAAALPGISFDWVVEEAFAEIPAWHAAVDRVIPVAMRRWRRRPFGERARREWRAALDTLRERQYDAVIDAQGLLKSAVVARLVPAPRHGLDRATARERLASLAYDHRIHVPRDMHAVERTRMLFARALAYPQPSSRGEYGIAAALATTALTGPRGLMFLHGTARREKLWPEAHWAALADLARAADYRVLLPWGSDEEQRRARRIARGGRDIEVLPRLGLRELAVMLQGVSGAVAVDTGLGHLSAALAVPTVSLYGPTSPRLVGAYGRNQAHLQAPLAAGASSGPAARMGAITAAAAWQALRATMAGTG